jgi:uncharacterized membrane-anchored protein YhcB (DUF1043 family)
MIREPRAPMTTLQLKQSMDRRFVRLTTSMNRRFKGIDTRLEDMDKRLEETRQELRHEMRQHAEEMRQHAEETRRHFEETCRHFDVIAESLRDDFRLFADAIANHSTRLDQHEVRIVRLESRPRKA